MDDDDFLGFPWCWERLEMIESGEGESFKVFWWCPFCRVFVYVIYIKGGKVV